jgi:hypothetical protein
MRFPLFLLKRVLEEEYTNRLYGPFHFLIVVFGSVDTQGLRGCARVSSTRRYVCRLEARPSWTFPGPSHGTAQGSRLQHREISFVSLTEQIDTTTPSGTLIFHLMAALAEFERDIIRERTNAGLAAARARGNVGGRPRKLQSNAKVALAHQLFASKEHSISELCSALGISRATLYRYVKEVTPSVSNS